jgi:hypothetical protein
MGEAKSGARVEKERIGDKVLTKRTERRRRWN